MHLWTVHTSTGSTYTLPSEAEARQKALDLVRYTSVSAALVELKDGWTYHVNHWTRGKRKGELRACVRRSRLLDVQHLTRAAKAC